MQSLVSTCCNKNEAVSVDFLDKIQDFNKEQVSDICFPDLNSDPDGT